MVKWYCILERVAEYKPFVELILTVDRHDLIGLKKQKFCPVENNRKGKNGLRVLSSGSKYLKYLSRIRIQNNNPQLIGRQLDSEMHNSKICQLS